MTTVAILLGIVPVLLVAAVYGAYLLGNYGKRIEALERRTAHKDTYL